MPAQPRHNAPCSPNNANTPMPATSVGKINGSISSRNTNARPANCKRANAHAIGTPSTVVSTTVAAA